MPAATTAAAAAGRARANPDARLIAEPEPSDASAFGTAAPEFGLPREMFDAHAEPDDAGYQARRSQIETYFDRTAADAWKRLTSDAPLSGIRATVRAGRDAMRATLLGWLPADLSGRRLLDAGCGTGALAVEAARRGASVVAIDLSATLVKLAGERLPESLGGSVDFRVGDMADAALGRFDYVVAMDSLIHYAAEDALGVLARLAPRVSGGMLFTFAPRTPMLALMHATGRLFPRADRAPSIVPVRPDALLRAIPATPGLERWRAGRGERIDRGFYKSQALELVAPGIAAP